MAELYTPFMEQVGATLGRGMMQREQNKLAQSAYMGDQDALGQLMGVNPELANKIQSGKATQQQNKLMAAQKSEDRGRKLSLENEKIIQGELDNIAKFDTYEEALPYFERRKEELRPVIGDVVDNIQFTPESFEQLKQIEGGGQPFEGTSMGAQTGNMLTRGVDDPDFRNSPEYAMAYYEETKPRIIRTPTGDIIHKPSLPSIFKAPGEVKTEEQEIEAIKDTVKKDVEVIPGTEKEIKTTEGEKTSAGFYSRMIASASRMERLGEFDSASLWERFRGMTNITASPELQQYRQNADDWIRAKLRKESGAVIGKSEMEKEYEMYFPQIGDRQAVIDQKAEARTEAEGAMRIGAGKAAKKLEAGKKTPKISEANLSVTIDGTTHKFPSKQQFDAYREAAGL